MEKAQFVGVEIGFQRWIDGMRIEGLGMRATQDARDGVIYLFCQSKFDLVSLNGQVRVE